MRKLINILILLLISSQIISAQDFPFLLKVDNGGFTPADSAFQFSITVKIIDTEIDSIQFSLHSEMRRSVRSTKFFGENIPTNTKIEDVEFLDYFGSTKTLILDTRDTLFNPSAPIKFFFEFESSKEEKIDISIDVFKGTERTMYSSLTNINSVERIPSINLMRFEPQKKAEKSLLIQDQGFLKFNLISETINEDLLFDFWSKSNLPSDKFFYIVNIKSSDTLLSIGSDSTGKVTVQNSFPPEFIQDDFIGRNQWNHYLIKFSKNDQMLSTFINNKLIYSNYHIPISNLSDFEIVLSSSRDSGKVSFENFRIWDSNTGTARILNNMHYGSWSLDSSRIVLGFNFDDESEIESLVDNDFIKIEKSEISFLNSDAPIFSLEPQLTVFVYNDFYTLEWFNSEIENVESFTVQKSSKGESFEDRYTETADLDPEHKYFYSDLKEEGSDLLFYRIKQINKDGSEIYSASLKIGQGSVERFLIDQNFPNPFNPRTMISLEVYETDQFEILVYNLVGKEIAFLHNGILDKGNHQFTFDGANLPSGHLRADRY